MWKKRLRKFIYAPRDFIRFRYRARQVERAYQISKEQYASFNRVNIRLPIDQVGVTIISDDRVIDLGDNFRSLIENVRRDALVKIKCQKNCWFHLSDRQKDHDIASSRDSFLEEMPEVQERTVRNIFLKNASELDGMQELAEQIASELEQHVYGSYIGADYVSYYRTMDCRMPETGATLWHSDNHYEGVIKCFIFMCDVNEENAPFEYMRNKETGKPIHITPRQPQKYYGGRVPFHVIDHYLANGYENKKVTGTFGTVMLLDDKIIHRGNFAHAGHYRDVVMMQFSPRESGGSYITSDTKNY